MHTWVGRHWRLISFVIVLNLFCSVSSCTGLSYRPSSRNQQQSPASGLLGGDTGGWGSTWPMASFGFLVSLWRSKGLIAFQSVDPEAHMIKKKKELSISYFVSLGILPFSRGHLGFEWFCWIVPCDWNDLFPLSHSFQWTELLWKLKVAQLEWLFDIFTDPLWGEKNTWRE